MQAVIMAGGRGTRLAELTKNEIPKPMAPILGKPILFWQLEQLKKYNIHKVIMTIGFLGEKIVEYFGDGSKFGLEIEYIVEEEPLGSAGAFAFLKDRLDTGYFLLISGDILFDIDLGRMERYHVAHGARATILVHPNSHPYDSDIVKADSDGRVIVWDSKHNQRNYWYDNCVNAGISMIDKSVCDYVPVPKKINFENDIIARMIAEGERVYAYRSPEYVRDVGTVDRIEKAARDLDCGYVESRNLSKRQKAIFLDRDGCINILRGFMKNEAEFELEAGVTEAIGLINSSGYLAIVITNQPVVARGGCTIEELENIHNKMKTLLGKEGVFVDEVLYCPHHPERGYQGERPEYKIECNCRKPKTGMIDLASDMYNIEVSKSWMVGDSTLDIQLANNAGCHSALLLTGEAGQDGKYNITPDLICKNLLDAVKKILG